MNSKRGAVSFEAGGVSYALAFTTNAMVRYQDAMSETITDGFAGLEGGGLDVARLRALFWAAITPEISIGAAGDLIDELGLTDGVPELLQAAVVAAFPDAEDGAAKNPPARLAKAG